VAVSLPANKQIKNIICGDCHSFILPSNSLILLGAGQNSLGELGIGCFDKKKNLFNESEKI